jgi:hypothetical protein
MVLVRILMSKSGFKDEVLIKFIVGVVMHVTDACLYLLTIEAGIEFCRQQLRRENQHFGKTILVLV